MLSLGGHQIFIPIQWFECLLAILNFWLADQGRQFVYAGNFLTTMSGVLDVITNYSRTTGGCDDKHGGKDCLANPCYLETLNRIPTCIKESTDAMLKGVAPVESRGKVNAP